VVFDHLVASNRNSRVIVSPRAFAVFRLMTNSKLVGLLHRQVRPALEALAQATSGVDCQATNFQPWGVFAQALRNSSFRLRGWPPISASIAARPVTSATSPITRTLRSVQLTLLYLVLPDCIDCSQVAFVSVTPGWISILQGA
jgi:hypothetical protein